MNEGILTSQVVLRPLQSVKEVANFSAAMDTLIDQDGMKAVSRVQDFVERAQITKLNLFSKNEKKYCKSLILSVPVYLANLAFLT